MIVSPTSMYSIYSRYHLPIILVVLILSEFIFLPTNFISTFIVGRSVKMTSRLSILYTSVASLQSIPQEYNERIVSNNTILFFIIYYLFTIIFLYIRHHSL